MAVSNSTETSVNLCCAPSVVNLLNLPELEKISCSIKGKKFVHPLELMGKRIRFAEILLVEIGLFEGSALESYISNATVLAVNVGSIKHGIQTSLFLQDDDSPDPYYTDISKLTVLDVLQ